MIAPDADVHEGDAGKASGFSLHAGVAAEAHEGQKLERLWRYIARPDAKLRAQPTTAPPTSTAAR